MKILIFGAGVIGSIYAVKLSAGGFDVSVYARGGRLAELQTNGLLYYDKGTVNRATVRVLEKINPAETFDYVFVTVRYEQTENALEELKGNYRNIVTWTNTPNGYAEWENIIGTGKIIPAFAGAAGSIENGILHYAIVPRVIQPTTFGEIDGRRTARIKHLQSVFRTAGVPCAISSNMDAWQKCHLALVTPLANGIYLDGGNNHSTAKNRNAIRYISCSLKSNFTALKKAGIPVTPLKLNMLRFCPVRLMDIVLKALMDSEFGTVFIGSHANKAKSEMQALDRDFKALL
jgi:2-dehydropantoate 2-reductase